MIGQQKIPSSKGSGKWETNASLANYRKKRNQKNRQQKKDRKRNRR